MGLSLGADAPLAADIVFRYMQRLAQALAGRLERLEESGGAEGSAGVATDTSDRRYDKDGSGPRAVMTPADAAGGRRGIGRIATFLGRIMPRAVAAPDARAAAPGADGLPPIALPARIRPRGLDLPHRHGGDHGRDPDLSRQSPPHRARFRPVPGPLAVNPAADKTASNYLRALKRRVWMVLAVAVPLAVLGCIYALRVAAGLPRQGRDRDQRAGL